MSSGYGSTYDAKLERIEEKEANMNSPVDELKLCPICKGDGYAAEGELIDKLGKWISGLPKDKPCPGREMADAIVLITESYIALQSRSTPPPVAGGELDKLKRALDDCTYSFDGRTKMQAAFDSYLAALQHQDGVCQYRINADGFANTDCGEELYIEFGADYTPTFCQCCGKRAQRQSLERNNGQ